MRVGGCLGARFIGLTRGRDMTHQQNLVLVAEAGASVERDLVRGLTLRLAGDRQGWPAWDDRFVIDDRATLSLAVRRGRARAHRRGPAPSRLLSHPQGPHRSRPLGLRCRRHLRRPIWASETMLLLATHADQQRDWRR